MATTSAIRETFDLLEVPMEMIELTGRMRYRLPHGDYDQASEGGGLKGLIAFAFDGDAENAEALFQSFLEALNSIPDDSDTFREWLAARTDNKSAIDLFQGFCAALMGTNLHEIPAGEFFRFLKYSSRGSRFGMAIHGNGSLMEALGEGIEKRGSVIRRRTACRAIHVRDNRVTGVTIVSKDRGEELIDCDLVLSNTGPLETIDLVGGRDSFAPEYLAELDAWPHEAPIFHVSFVIPEPLIEGFQGCMVFGNTTNLIYLEIPSLINPEHSEPGAVLHTAFGAPSDATTANLKEELDNTIRELEANFPGQLANAQYLVRAKHSGRAPGMHRWAGRMMPVSTLIENLYNVGDGCTSPGTIGTEGAAASAREAVAQIVAGQS